MISLSRLMTILIGGMMSDYAFSSYFNEISLLIPVAMVIISIATNKLCVSKEPN